MNNKLEGLTPVLKQYMEYQLKYPEAIILFEIGTFYETYQLADKSLGYAEKAAQLTDMVLTRKSKADPNSPYMAGFPSHTIDLYIKKLLKNGEQVVVVSQRKIIKNNKQIVERYLDKICSPGTVIENLSEERSNYYASLYEEYGFVGVTLVDISTGEVQISEIQNEELEDFLLKVNPSEILITGNIELDWDKFNLIHKNTKKKIIHKLDSCGKLLEFFYDLKTPTSNPAFHLSTLGIERWRFGSLSFGNLINYLSDTEMNRNLLMKMSRPQVVNSFDRLDIPLNGLESLNITGENGLIDNLDKCKTAMGKRLLRNWIRHPLVNKEDITERLNKVEDYIKNSQYHQVLSQVYDLPRLSRKIILLKTLPIELSQIYNSLKICEDILLKENDNITDQMNDMFQDIENDIDFELISTCTNKDYSFFKGELKEIIDDLLKQKDSTFKKLKKLKSKYEEMMSTIETKRKIKCSLKFTTINNVYKLEGTKALAEVIENSDLNLNIKKKTSSFLIDEEEFNLLAEQYFSQQQKYYLKCEKIWNDFLESFSNKYTSLILSVSEKISKIDVLTTFAKISKERFYNKPEFIESEKSFINGINIRHPIVEVSKTLREAYVPNDINLDENKNLMCVYGANSSGKSTLLRSVALNILMAQMGCFVPSTELIISPFESILTRMSMSDNINEGESTFVVEMKEFNKVIKNLHKRSLILLDEIGRGTSAHEGEAIAFAALDYFSNAKDNNSVGFFATHYHELADKINNYPNILINHIESFIQNDKLFFVRKLKEGAGNGSYGIEVAKICGLPDTMIRVASNYNKKYGSLTKSNYNSRLEDIICPLCNKNSVQETHHIIEQKQGQIKTININGQEKSINDLSNIMLICGQCHNDITHGRLIIEENND